jgi:hypothetical protein
VEDFYAEIGGIIGYHHAMLSLLCQIDVSEKEQGLKYHAPTMVDISQEGPLVDDAIFHAIEHMPDLAEIYPVGGAADRLNLVDPVSKQPLPAAELAFCGKTLLERLIIDVQVKEYLHYKLIGKRISIPIGMMTSTEKDNHQRILKLCEKNNYFNKGKDAFFFFCQPLVPTITGEGTWAVKGVMQPLLRPGGHGVIWKLARDSGCFNWLQKQNIKKIIVRQINNPIASEDYGLYAFSGVGLKRDYTIGFCSCPRVVRSAEGTNVLVEKRSGQEVIFTLTSIEYCDFAKYGISDEPMSSDTHYSKFPSNTNLLFLDLEKLHLALQKTPIPGMLVNLKKISYVDETGARQEKTLARLESMMQNIADSYYEQYDRLPVEMENSYITFNSRSKTISTTKKEYVLGASLMETPEGCYVDMMRNARELLARCNVIVHENTLAFHPNFSFLYHPALGPMYSVIAQKMRGGKIMSGSELELWIADIDVSDFHLQGSLRISADNIMGDISEQGLLQYGDHTGKCTLKNVSIINSGVDYESTYVPWKLEVTRKQSCSIHIQGNGEFYAENVVFEGDVTIVVKSGTKVTAFQQGAKVCLCEEIIDKPSWSWDFLQGPNNKIVLDKKIK